MQSVNKDGFGQKLYVDFNQDISANTALTITFRPEAGDEIDKTPTLETTDIYVGDQYYQANQYVSYTVEDGVFDGYIGRYQMKATATLATETVATRWEFFRVTA